jgi:hypothetical protein
MIKIILFILMEKKSYPIPSKMRHYYDQEVYSSGDSESDIEIENESRSNNNIGNYLLDSHELIEKNQYLHEDDDSMDCDLSVNYESMNSEIVEEQEILWAVMDSVELDPKDLKEVDFDKNEFKNENVLKYQSPFYYFSLFLQEDFYQYILTQTNEYINFCSDNPNFSISYNDTKLLDKITVDTIKKYIGLNFLTGIIRIPNIANYWSESWIYNFSIFRKTMSRDLFFLLGKYIHFNSNYLQKSSNDKIFKIRPIVEYLREKWNFYGFSTNRYTIDETMID